MKKIIISGFIFIIFAFVGISFYLFNARESEDAISRIGIGGGGAFFNPMIDPTDENVFYVTSDMGAFYYSYNNQAKSSQTTVHGADWQFPTTRSLQG